MSEMTVSIASIGRNGTYLYESPHSNVIVGTIDNEGYEAVIQPVENNGRVFVKLAMGLEGWVVKRSVKFSKIINITLI